MANKCERCGNHRHIDGHPNRPFCDLSDETQSSYLRELLKNHVAGFRVDPSDMFPQYTLFVAQLPTYVVGAWLLECAFKFLIRSKNDWDDSGTRTHKFDELFAKLDVGSQDVFRKHFEDLRLSVSGWENPRESIEDFFKVHSRSWEVYRYAPIEKIDMGKNPAYPLLEIRELCIAAIHALVGSGTRQYGTLGLRVLWYMTDDFEREWQDRWHRAQSVGGGVVRPANKYDAMRRIDMALWESGVVSHNEYALIRMENEFKRQVDELARAVRETQLGIKIEDMNNPGAFITPLDQHLRDSWI